MKKRIWELDAARGICILGMVAVHFIFDLTQLYQLVSWQLPEALLFLQNWGGVLFLLISGICVTLGSRSIQRGSIVFSCGMLCTAVTAGMVFLGLADKGMRFPLLTLVPDAGYPVNFAQKGSVDAAIAAPCQGNLHCLGICMLLWPLIKTLPTGALAAIGTAVVLAGLWLDANVRVSFSWLIPLGILPWGFVTADYFPLLPYAGFFLVGTALGRLLYAKKQSLLPSVNAENPVLRFLQWTGRHSLPIYLLHQPVLTGLFELILLLK